MMVLTFRYFSGLLTQEGNTPGLFSLFSSPIVRTIGVEIIFTEQYSNAVGPSCPIIQSPMVTSPMVEVVVGMGHNTQMGDDDWVSTEINFDSQGFKSDKNVAEEEWFDEDSNNDEDEDDQPYNNVTAMTVGEPEPRLHGPP